MGIVLVPLLLLTACPSTKDPDDTGEGLPCPLLDLIEAHQEATPGSTLDLGIWDQNSGFPYAPPIREYDVHWEVSVGEVADPDAKRTTWTLPDDLAVYVAETATVTATATAEGCEPSTVDLDVAVDWPLSERVIVIYNPLVEGSLDVAEAYATFRQIPADRLCPVEYADPVTVTGADWPTFAATVQDCIDTPGLRVQYLVPVYGVPYKVSDRIMDLAGTGAYATVSLDALLFAAEGSVSANGPIENPAYQDGDSMGGWYAPYVPFGELRPALEEERFWQRPAYLVARIDGASAEAAMDLVTRTAEAQALADDGALEGLVYVDGNRGDDPPTTDDFGSYESGEWNMWGTREIFETLDHYAVVWDGNAEEFGTEPAPTTCPSALYYAGWYSYYHYNDVFTWQPGAIGGHLDSCSACDIRAEGTWSGTALARGITATFGAVNEPYVAGMPEYDQFYLYLLQGATYGEAAYQSTLVGYWMMVWVGDPLYRPHPEPLLVRDEWGG